jgi:hypothetical protein
MRVALFVVSMVIAATPVDASGSCMTKAEARHQFGPVHIYWHGADHCWDATATRRPRITNRVARKVEPPAAFASALDTGSRKENASNQESRVPIRSDRNGKGSAWQDSMSKMMPDDEPVQTTWVDRWTDIEPTPPPLVARWVDIPQAMPPPLSEAPPPSFRGVLLVLVFIVIAVTLAVIEVLFRVALVPPWSSRNSFKKAVLL